MHIKGLLKAAKKLSFHSHFQVKKESSIFSCGFHCCLHKSSVPAPVGLRPTCNVRASDHACTAPTLISPIQIINAYNEVSY